VYRQIENDIKNMSIILPLISELHNPSMRDRHWVPFNLGGTALLISVVVTMDFWSQVQSHLMSHQYDSLMKKSKLGNYGRSGI
jgi:preprotein translocase subunit SecY